MALHRLRVTAGQAAGTSIDLGDELIVGRKEEGPGQLAGDREISRRHARIYAEPGGGLAIEDLGSTNGTFVDGERVTGSRPLPDGATLLMGQTTLVVEVVEEAAQPDAPPPPADATQIDAPPPPPDATQIDAPVPADVAQPDAPPPPPDATQIDLPPPGDARPEPPPAEEAAPPPVEPPPTAPLPPSLGVPAPPGAAPPPLPPPPPAPPGGPPAGPPAPSRSGPPRVLIAVLVGVLVLAGLGIAAVLVFTGDDDEEDKKADLPVTGPPALVSAARAAGCTATTEPSEGDQHVDSKPTYRSNPPHSGPHDPTPAGDGQYRTAPPIETLVHSLEHGRIVMWFKPGDNATRDKLLAVGNDDPRHMILTPNTTGMPYEAAASAWRHVLGCPEMNDKVPNAVRAFRDAYRDKGPEQVP